MISANVTRLSAVPLDDFEVADDGYVLVPDGRYSVVLTGWLTGTFFVRSPKVCLTFKIVDPGEHHGKEISKWYNVKRFLGKAGKNGRFQVARGSALFADYIRLAGMTARTDRLSLSKLRNLVIAADIETVVRDRNQNQLPELLRYSIIRNLRSIEAGTTQALKP